MKLILQFSARLINPNDPILPYYWRAWDRSEGYAYPSVDFLELPMWSAYVSHELKGSPHRFDVVRALPYTISSDVTEIWGSVLDVNLKLWRDLVKANPSIHFELGGYVKPDSFADLMNVHWNESMPSNRPDYSLFAGYRTIPRLTLSRGCLYCCAFCTIPRKLELLTLPAILRQADSFKPLRFKLVYLDDKTFGQASNWRDIRFAYAVIKRYNPEFLGFIVQTTASMAIKYAREWVQNYHVRYIEIGVETLDAKTLRSWRKANTPELSTKAAETIKELQDEGYSVKLIPNIILGIASDERGPHNYQPTIDWLRRFKSTIAFINPYLLCQYHNSKGGKYKDNSGDLDETRLDKSWLTIEEQRQASAVLDQLLEMFE